MTKSARVERSPFRYDKVLCLEGDWDGALTSRSSVLPMLQLLERLDTLRFVHRDVGTRAELIHYINLWLDGDRSVEDYFVLYLAFHGTKRRQRGRTSTSVWISDADDGQVTLSELADVLGSNLVDVVIHFGSCWTMAADTGYLTDFVKRTKVKAVAGYTKPVDWVQSAAMDLLFFDRISRYRPGQPRAMRSTRTRRCSR